MTDDKNLEDFIRRLLDSGETVRRVFYADDTPPEQREAISDLLAGMFAPLPNWWKLLYTPEMLVVNRRVVGANVPAGTRGVVTQIEQPKSEFEASGDYHKGRTITVAFDCSTVPMPPYMVEMLRRSHLEMDIPAYLGVVTTAVQPQDIQPVPPEANRATIERMTDECRQANLTGALMAGMAHEIVRTGQETDGDTVYIADAITLYRAGVYDLVGISGPHALFRLTEFGWHVARALAQPPADG